MNSPGRCAVLDFVWSEVEEAAELGSHLESCRVRSHPEGLQGRVSGIGPHPKPAAAKAYISQEQPEVPDVVGLAARHLGSLQKKIPFEDHHALLF